MGIRVSITGYYLSTVGEGGGVDILQWHMLAMLAAWGGLIPGGIVVARFFKVTPGQDFPRRLDNRLWWDWHRVTHYAGIGIALAGGALMAAQKADHGQSAHAMVGLVALAAGALQIVSAWLRGTKGGPTDPRSDSADPATWRGDHYDMTRRRRLFEAWHKTMGYVALALAFGAAATGLALIAAGWLAWCVLGAAGAAFAGSLIGLAAWKTPVATYQAIWGTDRRHPGNGAVEDGHG